MKDNLNKYSVYLKWGITAFAVVAFGIVFYFGIDYLGNLFKFLGKIVGILSPFIWGLIITYLLMPLMGYVERNWYRPLVDKINKKKPNAKLSYKLARGLAVLTAEIFMLVIITALLYLIIPQVYDSIATIVVNSPDYVKSVASYLDKLLHDYPQIEQYAVGIFGNMSDALSNWFKNTLMPGMENIVTNISTSVIYVLKGVYNIVIGIVVSVYILSNREGCRTHAKKLMYSLFSKKTVKKIFSVVRFADKTFMGFLSGKTFDSLIIGVICYVFCLLVNMPYALLVAVIVGVTNIIPFFGPFIGAIPSALLILMVNPGKCLVFIIFIAILQQLDGSVIGPKILGNSIGINGFWVMFSIILGGGLFGFWGMLLGVPVFVIIYAGISKLVKRKLIKENLPLDDDIYEMLDYIDPDDGTVVMYSKEELANLCSLNIEKETDEEIDEQK